MSGIYIHIPFCKKACHYCDFHFSTQLKTKGEMKASIIREIQLRKDYLGEAKIKTIYFGGGTPSLFSIDALKDILDCIYQYFDVSTDAEITLEANPDDLSKEKLTGLKSIGINRLSIGIQTFDEKKLQFINRSHTAKEALECLALVKEVGFTNVSTDLIFAIPPHDITQLLRDIEILLSFDFPHVSVYGLTIEEQTVFGRWFQKGKLKPVSEQENLEQYQLVIKQLTNRGFEHYEVSNFAKPGFYSRHNTSYWQGTKYLGIGPGAHSYNVHSRSYNVRNNQQYISSLAMDKLCLTEEILSLTDRRNEYMMTRIRTKWGLDLQEYLDQFGHSFESIDPDFIGQLIAREQAIIQDGHFYLTLKGLFLADEISARLFLED